MIDLNATFFVQFVNFVLILILLNVILIGPIRRVLKKRAEFVASQMEGIESFTSSADTKLKDYEAALDAARVGFSSVTAPELSSVSSTPIGKSCVTTICAFGNAA